MDNHVDIILNFCQIPETIIIESSNIKFLRNVEKITPAKREFPTYRVFGNVTCGRRDKSESHGNREI